MNPKAETCEDLQSRRKRLHLGMCRLAREDLERKALEKEAEFQVSLSKGGGVSGEPQAVKVEVG